jgi:nucleoid DNA-binding protein
MFPKIDYTPQELQIAIKIVQQDLFNSLLKVKSGQTIKLGKLGRFTKTERKQRCG